MIRNDDYFEIIKEQNKELAKFRPFKSAYEMKQEIERLNKELERWIKLINYNEIEDIPQYIEDLEVDNKSLKQENKILNSIIKEVREYIKTNGGYIEDMGRIYDGLNDDECTELLNILDKENK